MFQKKVFTLSLILAANIQLFAQTDSISVQQLKNVEIAGKQSSILNRSGVNLQIISAPEIALLPVQSVDELLDYIAGIDMRQRGKSGVQADISIRGSSSDQIVALLNGINITDAHTGHYNLNIPLDLSAVERIEVLQGSDSRLLGTTAFGGAINIITATPANSGASAGIAAGADRYIYQNANLALATKATAATMSFSRQKSDGYTENTDFDITNIYLQSTYNNVKAGKIQLQAGLQEKGAGANDFYYFGGVQYDWQRTFFAALSWKKQFSKSANISAQAYWRQLHNRFETYRDFKTAPETYTAHNYHKTDIAGGQMKMERFSAKDRTAIGIDLRNEHILSNKLGNPLADTRPVPFAPDNIHFTYGKNRLQATVFADEALYLNKLTLTGGIGINQSNDYGTNFSGGADATYNFPNIKMYVAANRTFRFPTYTDLYYTTDESHTSDPNLKPEKATSIEVGAKYAKSGLKVAANLFLRAGTDIIDWIRPFQTTEKWKSTHGNINAMGGDISVIYIFKDKFFIRKMQWSYSYLTQDKKRIDGYDSKYALDYLKHKTVLNLNHKIYKNLGLHWTASWQDRNGNYTKDNKSEEYKPFFLLDARLQWEIDAVNIFADFNNITNTEYADFGGLTMPRFNFCAGMRIRFQAK
ncbi:MAG: TonB-dependent receptor [Prevotellaceae bacterium]|jgi:iron complex outermembrane receptor protein|nr:TonB-dependent receptor [Prevotellaceae bacterium]